VIEDVMVDDESFDRLAEEAVSRYAELYGRLAGIGETHEAEGHE
jgi:hypothetical protein